MFKRFAVAALATTILGTPALARDNSWYIELDGGATLREDADFTLNGSPSRTQDFKTGYDFAGIVGYDWGMFRLEAESGYRRVADNGVRIGGTSYASSVTDGTGSALSFTLNGLLDFGPDDGLQGFVGGGAGVARIRTGSAAPVGANISDSDARFAWQALAGIRAPLSDRWDAGLKYRFFNANNVKAVDALGQTAETRFRSHSLMATLTYNFGGAPAEAVPPPVVAPAPQPAPPPAPPPPPPPVCAKGPYIVFFNWDQSDITPEAATILDSAVTAYGNCQRVPVMLAGHADRSGKPAYNVGLSERRNAAVSAYLTARGVPASAISSHAFGESMNRVPTADGVRELQNRRVEISYGPGSGM